MADVNNERAAKNESYARALSSLTRLALVRFADDATVVPRDSAWFSSVNSADGAVVPARETALWREDWVGLRALDAAGRVDFLTAPGPHMHITRAWFREEVVDRYLKGGGLRLGDGRPSAAHE